MQLSLYIYAIPLACCTGSKIHGKSELNCNGEKTYTQQRTHLFVSSDSCEPCLSTHAFIIHTTRSSERTKRRCIQRDKRKAWLGKWFGWHTIFIQPCYFMAAITYAIHSRTHTHRAVTAYLEYSYMALSSFYPVCMCVYLKLNSRMNSGTVCERVTC